LAHLKKGRHLIVSAIEHHSVLNSARFLEKFHDFEVTFLPVNKYGQVETERLQKTLRPTTVLVSILHGSNEIGTVENLPELAAVCRSAGVLFHSDAVATVGNIPLPRMTGSGSPQSFRRPKRSQGSGSCISGPTASGASDPQRYQETVGGGGTENVPGIGPGHGGGVGPCEADTARHSRKLGDRLVAASGTDSHAIYTGHRSCTRRGMPVFVLRHRKALLPG
jgi:cysteine desulfurase